MFTKETAVSDMAVLDYNCCELIDLVHFVKCLHSEQFTFKIVFLGAIENFEQFDLVHFLGSPEWGSRGLNVVPGKL